MPYRLLLCLLLLVSPLAHPSIMPAVLAAEQAQTKGIRLVIMPFKNLTRVADDDWLSDSFAESLTMGLIKVEALQLVERSQLQNLLKEQAFSQSAYVDESTAPRLGQMLGANVVVLGSFQKVGDQLQANVRFVDVETGKIDGKRAAQVQGQFNAIFDLQKQLATELISQLNIQARPAELAELEKTVKATDSPEANRLYLEGLKYLRLGDSQFLDKARDAFREALEIDADYALALAGLAEVHTRKVRDLGQLRVLPPNMDFSVRGPDDAALARKYADKALALQPELPQVLRALAWLEQVEGHRPQALELIRRAIRKDPRDSDSIVAYVSFRFENSDIALGAKQVRQELGSLGANLDDPWVQYTVAALATGQEATKPRPQMGWIRELLEQAQTKLPDYPLIPITLATVAQSEGKPEESLRHLRRAYELGKDSPDVLGYLATIYLGQSDPQTAFRLVQEAEAIKPDHLYIQMTKAQALFALGRKAESDALYEQLERRSPDNVMISMTRGVQYMAYEHDFVKAAGYLRQALERWEENSQGLPRYMLVYLLAVSEMAADQYPAARGHFEELLRDPVYYGPAYEQLANIYRFEKNYAKALEAYSAYLTIHPEARESAEVQQQYRLYYLLDQWAKDGENVAVLNDLGQIYQHKKNFSEAESYWVLALDLAPDNPVILYNLGSLYLTTQKLAQARPLLEKAVTLKSDYVKAWYNLGLARQQMGDSAGAKAAWQKVLALDPTHAGAQKALAGQP